MLRNTPDSFGLVTRALHWGIAALILVQLPLGLRLGSIEPGLSNLWLFAFHKSLGMTVFTLMAARLLWHIASPPPAPQGGGWQALAARLVHGTIYALMLAIPLSGWIGSSATGIDTVIWGITIPPIAPASEAWEDAAFTFHDIATKLFMALLALHIGAALKREMDGDGTLTRMIRGRAQPSKP